MVEYNPTFTDEFLQYYKKLEEVQSKYPVLYEKYKQSNYKKIESFRSFRNLLAHNESSLNYPAIVSNSFLQEIKDVVSKLTTKSFDVCTKKSDLCVAELDDEMDKVIRVMNKHNFSRIPILDNKGAVRYIITEKAILAILAESSSASFGKGSLVKDYLPYFEINRNPKEKFIFVGRNEPAYQVEQKLGHLTDQSKTSVAFVTESGDKNEAILGLITASNLLNF